jgi:hypothetical protein
MCWRSCSLAAARGAAILPRWSVYRASAARAAAVRFGSAWPSARPLLPGRRRAVVTRSPQSHARQDHAVTMRHYSALPALLIHASVVPAGGDWPARGSPSQLLFQPRPTRPQYGAGLGRRREPGGYGGEFTQPPCCLLPWSRRPVVPAGPMTPGRPASHAAAMLPRGTGIWGYPGVTEDRPRCRSLETSEPVCPRLG